MNWIKVTIYTTTEGIEPVCGRLLNVGVTGFEIEDEADFKDFLENNRDSWDYVDDDLLKEKSGETCVKTYVSSDDPESLSLIRSAIAELKDYDSDGLFGRLDISLGDIKEEDWANNWKKYFHTMEIGDSLVVKPYWEQIDKTDKKVFEINPGLTFGTGSHHTTRLCLEDIQDTVKQDDLVLDLGCGSGILSIVSLMYGAKRAIAVDIDENSLETAYDNLGRNGLDRSSYEVLIGNVLTNDDIRDKILENQYDVVLANIVADVIIALLPFVKTTIKPDGVFITSGIIEDRRDEVYNALLNSGFDIISEKSSADWREFKCKLRK